MAYRIPTISTDELLERIASASASGWRHRPASRETRGAPRSAERRPRFARPPTTPRLTESRRGDSNR
jgi:hypothetical protein